MTYRLNPIIEKIQSPVRLLLPDETAREYESGKGASDDVFERNYVIGKITAEDSIVVVDLLENDTPAVNWTGEEQSFF